jgi:hypothetical protein
MAYTAREDDIGTFADEEIKRKTLKVILVDPITLAEIDVDVEAKKSPQGPHVCPKCRRSTLQLNFSGYWD